MECLGGQQCLGPSGRRRLRRTKQCLALSLAPFRFDSLKAQSIPGVPASAARGWWLEKLILAMLIERRGLRWFSSDGGFDEAAASGMSLGCVSLLAVQAALSAIVVNLRRWLRHVARSGRVPL